MFFTELKHGAKTKLLTQRKHALMVAYLLSSFYKEYLKDELIKEVISFECLVLSVEFTYH